MDRDEMARQTHDGSIYTTLAKYRTAVLHTENISLCFITII